MKSPKNPKDFELLKLEKYRRFSFCYEENHFSSKTTKSTLNKKALSFSNLKWVFNVIARVLSLLVGNIARGRRSE